MRGPSALPVPTERNPARLLLGFAAGALSLLIFHQGAVFILHHAGVVPRVPYPMQATTPFGIPQVWSWAFWCGIWGAVLAALAPMLPSGPRFWVGAFLFGAFVPTLVAWFVVFPLKGIPIGAGWRVGATATSLGLNGVWGLGTAIVLHGATRSTRVPHMG
jgi:hypothetical protein